MTANRITDFESWVRSVERRVLRLERRPLGSGGFGAGGVGGEGGGDNIQGGANGWAGMASFSGGVATIPLTNTKKPSGVLAGFNAMSGESAPLTASATLESVTLRATVSNGSYPVTILFLYP